MAGSAAPILQVQKLTKRFPGVLALDRVDLDLYPGEVLAVIGENGAGKSTLMKILAGIERADSGRILIEGAERKIDSVRDATALGISLIHQELNLLDNLDIGANIFLGREPHRWGLIDRKRIEAESSRYLERVGLAESPRTRVSKLPMGRRQIVEIAKALSIDARILIMDEPTSSLSSRETEQLYRVIRECRASGVSVIYISHRLGEVNDLADRVVVLRDGANAGQLGRKEIDHDAMVRLMVGRELARSRKRKPLKAGSIALEARDLVTRAHPKHAVSFRLRKGEIVGMAGLVGAGRTEILETLFGVQPALGGSILVEGTEVHLRNSAQAIKAGLALVPEDRKRHGVILEMALRENLSLASLRRDQRALFIGLEREKQLSRTMIGRLGIKAPSDRQAVRYLSGGNQQKVVLGKWLALKPKILLLDEPTRGIDVGSKKEVYLLMEELAEAGVAILFVSSEMEDILTMSDRALVLHEGAIGGELAGDRLTEEAVMQLATGASAAEPAQADKPRT